MASPNFKKSLHLIIGTFLSGLAVFVLPSAALPTVSVSYLYSLSEFTGVVPYGGGKIFVDKQRDETYVIYQNTVRVYNSSGLEVYRFGDNQNIGVIRDIAVDQDGSILLLSYSTTGDKYEIIRCNFRGDPNAKIEITGLPAGFNAFQPSQLAYRQGQIYLVDCSRLLVAVIDTQGHVDRSLDLYTLLKVEDEEKDRADTEKDTVSLGKDRADTEKDTVSLGKDRGDTEMDGFSLDKDGNMLFTVPVLFKAYRVSLDGKVDSFGRPGSLPGKFGIASAIVEDNQGNILVADKLKCVVSVFDKNYKFLLEFGQRGNKPENLVIPQGLAIDSDNRLYVVQGGSRGVSVFRMNYN